MRLVGGWMAEKKISAQDQFWLTARGVMNLYVDNCVPLAYLETKVWNANVLHVFEGIYPFQVPTWLTASVASACRLLQCCLDHRSKRIRFRFRVHEKVYVKIHATT